MNIKKLSIATIASFVVMFLLGGLAHMKLLHDFFMSNMVAPCDINRAEPLMPYIAGGVFLLALIMSYLYPKGVESANKMMEGAKFGIAMGIVWITPYQMVMYGSAELFTRKAILMDAVLHLIIGAIGGIVIAYCYGDKPKE